MQMLLALARTAARMKTFGDSFSYAYLFDQIKIQYP